MRPRGLESSDPRARAAGNSHLALQAPSPPTCAANPKAFATGRTSWRPCSDHCDAHKGEVAEVQPESRESLPRSSTFKIPPQGESEDALLDNCFLLMGEAVCSKGGRMQSTARRAVVAQRASSHGHRHAPALAALPLPRRPLQAGEDEGRTLELVTTGAAARLGGVPCSRERAVAPSERNRPRSLQGRLGQRSGWGCACLRQRVPLPPPPARTPTPPRCRPRQHCPSASASWWSPPPSREPCAT